ncbi:TPM domain-containing protein [Methylobacterium sp. ID0610]|uniref:TPM domain-containing protein n=1 Tax=Methylobacterium carpenticola TaxID=3344827 RepID=UPI00368AA9BA
MTGRVEDLLSRAACERIAAAVARAEAGTAGEIVVMVSGRAGLYRSVVLTAALAGGLVAPWPLLLLTGWSTGLVLLAQAGVVALILTASLSERLRLALMPRSLRRGRVREAAQFAFRARGLTRTRGRTGLLLFLALAERHAEIVADEGVLARLDARAWADLIADLTAALRRGEVEAGLVAAVTRLGERLAAGLPPEPGSADELPNRVIIEE